MKLLRFYLIITLASGAFLIIGAELAQAQTAPTAKAEVEVLNQEIAARKDKIKQLEETIANYKKQISEKQTEGVSLRNQLGILDQRVAHLAADIELTVERIKQAELEIEALNLAIQAKNQIIAKQKVIITQLVQTINARSQTNPVEILVSYQSFADFYNELKYFEGLYKDLGQSVWRLRLAKEDLDKTKQQVEEKRQTYQALKKDLEEKRQDLDEQIGFKRNLLAETKSSEQRYRTLLSSLKQQYQVIEQEVRTFEAQVRKKLAEQDKLARGTDVLFSWPTDSRYITARFHDPEYPFRRVFEHSGLDIRAAPGTPIRATAAGYVARARRCLLSSCYSYVLIVHTGNLSTVYGHLSNVAVTDDAFVNRGDVIGQSGGTPGTPGAGPFVTGPHLHFEVRLNGIPVDPLGYLVQ